MWLEDLHFDHTPPKRERWNGPIHQSRNQSCMQNKPRNLISFRLQSFQEFEVYFKESLLLQASTRWHLRHELSCTYYRTSFKENRVKPIQAKPIRKHKKTHSTTQAVTLKTEASELNYWMLEDPTWRIQNPHLVAPSASSSPGGTIRFGSPSRCGHHSASRSPSWRSTASISELHFELWLLGKALSNCGSAFCHSNIFKLSSPVS